MVAYAMRQAERAIDKGHIILVGDASGVDKAIRATCAVRQYPNLYIYKPIDKPLRYEEDDYIDWYIEHTIELGYGYLNRTKAMVDLADMAIHISNGDTASGTMASWRYALKRGIPSWLWINGSLISNQKP